MGGDGGTGDADRERGYDSGQRPLDRDGPLGAALDAAERQRQEGALAEQLADLGAGGVRGGGGQRADAHEQRHESESAPAGHGAQRGDADVGDGVSRPSPPPLLLGQPRRRFLRIAKLRAAGADEEEHQQRDVERRPAADDEQRAEEPAGDGAGEVDAANGVADDGQDRVDRDPRPGDVRHLAPLRHRLYGADGQDPGGGRRDDYVVIEPQGQRLRYSSRYDSCGESQRRWRAEQMGDGECGAAAEEQKGQRPAEALLGIPRQPRKRQRASGQRGEAVAEGHHRPPHRRDLDVTVENQDQRQHRRWIEHDTGVVAAFVPRHAFADHTVQQQPVRHHCRRGDERRHAPVDELQRHGAEAETDVQELSQPLVRFKHIVHRFNSLQ